MYDMIIIGKGPAGISGAIYGARANKSVLVLAKDFGWLSGAEIVENYYGFENPQSGMDLLNAGINQAKRLGVVFEDSEVVGVEKYENFQVTTTNNSYESKVLIIATGMPRKKASIRNLSAFEGSGVSYCTTCDGFFYRGKTVGIVGNTNYTLKEAHELLPFTKNITMFTLGRDFEGNNDLSSEEFGVIQIDKRKIDSLQGDTKLEKVVFEDGSEKLIDGLFIAEGTASALDLAYKMGIENDGKTITVNKNQETNIPGLYAAGDCTGGILQVAVAVGEGAVAGINAISYINSLVKADKA